MISVSHNFQPLTHRTWIHAGSHLCTHLHCCVHGPVHYRMAYFLCTIHTLMYSTHQFYMWQTIHLSDDGTNTLTHKHYCHMHMYSIQSTDCISICVPSLHNTHMQTHRHTGHFIGNRTTLKVGNPNVSKLNNNNNNNMVRSMRMRWFQICFSFGQIVNQGKVMAHQKFATPYSR